MMMTMMNLHKRPVCDHCRAYTNQRIWSCFGVDALIYKLTFYSLTFSYLLTLAALQ